MRYFAKALLVAAIVLLPSLAHAQSLTGTVRDASGAVLPGVTVEAASPVLIEKVRSAVTDGSGQYRIENLLPGPYTLTFTLPGFTTVKRDGVEVSGSGVVTINSDLRVGGIQETITVTGETPVVDTQTSTRRQTVLSSEVIQNIPASRGYGNLLATVPGIQATGLDVGSGVSTNFFTARGGRGNEGTIQIDGMNVGSAFNGGGVAGFGYPIGESSEIQVTISGGLGEVDRGGPQFNLIPKTGGNNFSGTAFLSTAGKWSQGDNLTDELVGFGLTERPGIDQELGHELRARWSDHQGSPLVLQQRQELRQPAGDSGSVRQPERRQSGIVDLPERRKPAGARRGGEDDRSHSSDRAGHSAKQGWLLSRLSAGVQRLRLHPGR